MFFDEEKSDLQKKKKTESLSLRLDAKTKFILEFISRMKGQSITTVIERSIFKLGNTVTVGGDSTDTERTWRHYWHTSEGVRRLKLALDPDIHTNFDEDELADFARAHHEFFFVDGTKRTIREVYVDLLSKKMDSYLDLWRKTRTENYWEAGKMMAKDLKAAGLAAPEWPRQPTSKSSNQKSQNTIDDDIPF